ncbi:MAG: 30S ribosomal protein S16 [Verrucomicrobiales bacterium]|nr:30S ribosomal protein S16 [Verrucomicrobiales bacterium]
MAVKIRLKREGTKNRAHYRVVVADGRAPKEGKILEAVGTYDPLAEGDNFKIDLEKTDSWIAKGAQPSDTVRSLIKKARKAAAAAE